MANNPLKKFKKLQTTNYDQQIKAQKFKKLSKKSFRRQSITHNVFSKINKLKELSEENEESLLSDEEIQNISFELSNVNEMNDLLDQFSNKSDEKVDIEYEGTTNEEGIDIIDEFLKDSTKQLLIQNKKVFDDDILNLSKDFYNDIINNLNLKENNNYEGNDSFENNTASINTEKKLKRKSFAESKNSNILSDSITSDENIGKLKNILIGQNDTAQSYGKMISLTTKNKNSSKFIIGDTDEDKIHKIRKKKAEK